MKLESRPTKLANDLKELANEAQESANGFSKLANCPMKFANDPITFATHPQEPKTCLIEFATRLQKGYSGVYSVNCGKYIVKHKKFSAEYLEASIMLLILIHENYLTGIVLKEGKEFG